MLTQLIINLAGSSFMTGDFGNLQTWRVVLDSADSIALMRDGQERVRVQLSGQRRWIAFNRIINGCPLYCIGWQETVGAMQRGGLYIGGSNRKTLAWLHPSGRVELE
jgi:hypothetical protein